VDEKGLLEIKRPLRKSPVDFRLKSPFLKKCSKPRKAGLRGCA